jgi:hypothetical protein
MNIHSVCLRKSILARCYDLKPKLVMTLGLAAASLLLPAKMWAQAPFGGTPAAIPGTIQNENYDTGGQGLAYNVNSINGTANSYRSDGVDLEATADTGGGDDLGWSSTGQWFKYTVNVATTGTYTVSFRVAAGTAVGSNAGSFHLQTPSGTNLSGAINIPGTGGWQTWTTITANVTLPAGQQVIELFEDVGGYNFNYMTFASSGTAPVISSPGTASGTVGSAFSYQITASHSPTSYGATGLPAGLSVNASTGLISGTPSAPGTSSVTLSATNASGTGNQALTLTVTQTQQAANPWELVGAADFNGDGKPDLIWQNTASGQRAIWLMNGTTNVSSVSLGTVTTDWEIAGAADFNGDGKPDLIWQNIVNGQRAIWLMNGTTYVSSVSLGTVTTDWEIVGAADFNKNGNSDLIWQNTKNGQRAIWLMNGTAYVSSVSLGTVTTDWDIVGAADLNGDGKPDLIWQNTASGQRAIWLMNGTTYVSSVSLGTVTTNWNFVGAADFNGDGKPDLIWQDTASNQYAFWLMNGTTYVSSVAYTLGLPQVTKPSFNPAGGTSTSAQNVTISDTTSSVSIRYTTDGSTPSETHGTLYSGPVNIGSTATLQAIAYASGYSDSPIASATYTINSTSTYPLTVSGGSGSGSYAPGSAVAITANPPPTGEVFAGWTGGTAANFANASSSSTTYTTIAAAETIVANYSGNSTPTNLALGKPITASSSNSMFPVTNANDGDVTTYWESAGLPATLTVDLGANANVTSVVVKLNPASIWSDRTQTIQVLGQDQSASTFNSLVPATSYAFSPNTGNTLTIPVTATARQIQLAFTTNSGAPGGQVAEIQVIGTPAPNPDFTITALTSTPATPIETNAITLNATVKNAGTAAAPATSVNFYMNSTQVGTASVGALAVGASTTVSANVGTFVAGSYTAEARVNESHSVFEMTYGNNNLTQSLTVSPAPGPDLQVLSITPSNPNPAPGAAVSFTVSLNNRGTTDVAAGTVTRIVAGSTTLNQTATPAVPAGATVAVTIPGTWTATNGNTTVTATADATNLIVETHNNQTLSITIGVGRGAIMPYDMYEAEDGTPGGGAVVVGPNRTIGDIAGEASGREAVNLPSTGAFVQWTTRADTNTVVARFSIPDGSTATLGVFNGATQVGTLNLVSKYSWLYGAEASPQKTGTGPRHIYDEANVLLSSTVPAGSLLQLRNMSSGTPIALDFMQLELATPIANPNPALYVTVSGNDQTAIQNAISTASSSSTAVGVYIPAGSYQVNNKFQISQKPLQIIGAGPWFTQLFAPQASQDTDVGFALSGAAATGSQFKNFALFGNYTTRQDGSGQPFNLTNVSNITIDNVWDEHSVVMVWGSAVSNSTFTNLRIRDTFADGINLSNNSQGNTVSNCEARSTGDDSFAMFNAQDVHAGNVSNNTFQNLTSLCTWRAAGLAVYGGFGNTMHNIYIADTLVYSGVTISSLSFGIPFVGFSGTTTLDNITVVRCGGHFWPNQQIWPGVWLQSAEGTFQGIRISNLDIEDPTYMGIMFQTKYVGSALNSITDTTFTNVTINRANTPRTDGSNVDATASTYNLTGRAGNAIYANPLPEPGQGPAVGAVSFTNLVMTNDSFGIVNTCPNFTITTDSNSTKFPLTVTSGTGSGSYATGTVVSITANPPPSGQVFAGWTGGTAADFANAASASTTYTTTASAQTITATYNPVSTTYPLTVTNGSGSGSYASGSVVSITANPPPSGQIFAGWTGGTTANFANAASASTTYTTVASAQTITATYHPVSTTYPLTVTSGSGSGSYASGSVVSITANSPPSGQVFAGWTGGTAANFANATSAGTTYTTVASAQTITATYTTGSSVPPNTPVLQINAGGGAVAPFVADTDFDTGTEFSSSATITTSGIANAAPAAVYQDVRWNASFNYTLPGLTPGASYVVRLHFVELSFTAAGQRVFNVAINGTTVLSNFDIFAQVGQNHALVEQFTTTATSSGQIVIALTKGPADNPNIAGIEIWTPAAIAAAPTGLSATGGNGQVNLVWNASTGATSYNVYRGTNAGGESTTPIATGVTDINYTDSTVTNGTTYYYKVAAVNSGGTSGGAQARARPATTSIAALRRAAKAPRPTRQASPAPRSPTAL